MAASNPMSKSFAPSINARPVIKAPPVKVMKTVANPPSTVAILSHFRPDTGPDEIPDSDESWSKVIRCSIFHQYR
jgi:hypothetical protein